MVDVSIVVLRTAVASAYRMLVAVGVIIIDGFDIANGYMHGIKLPNSADALAFTVSFPVGSPAPPRIAVGPLAQ